MPREDYYEDDWNNDYDRLEDGFAMLSDDDEDYDADDRWELTEVEEEN